MWTLFSTQQFTVWHQVCSHKNLNLSRNVWRTSASSSPQVYTYHCKVKYTRVCRDLKSETVYQLTNIREAQIWVADFAIATFIVGFQYIVHNYLNLTFITLSQISTVFSCGFPFISFYIFLHFIYGNKQPFWVASLNTTKMNNLILLSHTFHN